MGWLVVDVVVVVVEVVEGVGAEAEAVMGGGVRCDRLLVVLALLVVLVVLVAVGRVFLERFDGDMEGLLLLCVLLVVVLLVVVVVAAVALLFIVALLLLLLKLPLLLLVAVAVAVVVMVAAAVVKPVLLVVIPLLVVLVLDTPPPTAVAGLGDDVGNEVEDALAGPLEAVLLTLLRCAPNTLDGASMYEGEGSATGDGYDAGGGPAPPNQVESSVYAPSARVR